MSKPWRLVQSNLDYPDINDPDFVSCNLNSLEANYGRHIMWHGTAKIKQISQENILDSGFVSILHVHFFSLSI